jgi:3-methyl-2-oxobutanoate hydroxymethyltransferase
VADLPFGSYITPLDGVHSAVRLLKEGRADLVKLEGGAHMAAHVKALTDAGIAVVGTVLVFWVNISVGGLLSIESHHVCLA